MDTEDDIKIAIGDGREFKGKIPIIRVYNRALEQADVVRNFKAYKNRFDL